MRFLEAMRLLLEGKKVTCSTWGSNYIDLSDKGTRRIVCNFKDIDDEWSLYEEPKPKLTFMEVVTGLKQGKEYRRDGWKHPIHGYSMRGAIRYSDTQKHFFSIEDFEAKDWIEVDPKETL
jgi:hypothetical protein